MSRSAFKPVHHDERAPGWAMLAVYVVFPGVVWALAVVAVLWIAGVV
jgi:hypothetical protein